METKKKIEWINQIVSKENWFDMEIYGWIGGRLTIVGSTDFTYGHSLEIIFNDIFHLSIGNSWKSNTSKPIIVLIEGDEFLSLNLKYQVEQGYKWFKIIPEDFQEAFYIAAKSISYNTDKVLYYKKDNLGENERIADWV